MGSSYQVIVAMSSYLFNYARPPAPVHNLPGASESVKDVEITAIGSKRIIAPAGQSWDDWFDAPGVSSDFMTERNQPEDQIRETL